MHWEGVGRKEKFARGCFPQWARPQFWRRRNRTARSVWSAPYSGAFFKGCRNLTKAPAYGVLQTLRALFARLLFDSVGMTKLSPVVHVEFSWRCFVIHEPKRFTAK